MTSFVETASAIAREAGALVEELARQRVPFELKGDFDLVTAADRASEALVVERLRQAFPQHQILGEEGGEQGLSAQPADEFDPSQYRWYVDPVDGTTNFAHGFPVYNVTLAVARGKEMIAGVVFDPTRNELFAAERGSGAFLNGQPIRVSKTAAMADSLLATGFPSRKRLESINVHFFYQMAMMTHGVRRAGAAAIDLAYVACGRLDGFWEFGLSPWDMAAGLILIEEAGGRNTTMTGEPVHVRVPHLLSTNGQFHEEMLAAFGEIFAGQGRYTMPQIPRKI